jgi:hypothetical protein
VPFQDLTEWHQLDQSKLAGKSKNTAQMQASTAHGLLHEQLNQH